jgi:hypothetical protein
VVARKRTRKRKRIKRGRTSSITAGGRLVGSFLSIVLVRIAMKTISFVIIIIIINIITILSLAVAVAVVELY